MDSYQACEKSYHFSDLGIVIFPQLLGAFGLVYYWPYWTLWPWTLLYICLALPLGMSLTYHRCLSHRAFDFKYKWLERVFVTLGTLSLQRGPIYWSSLHRYHHKFSDTEKDPYYKNKSIWYAHMGWIIHLDPRFRVFRDPKLISDNVKDIAKDPYYIWLDKYFFLPWLLTLVVFYLSGGLPLVFWAGCIPFIYLFNAIFFLNSISHHNGYRSFEGAAKGDESKNNWFTGYLTLGEGWHNNHHAFPYSPKIGFFEWWQFDLVYVYIVILQKLGLISNLKTVSSQDVQAISIESVK